MRSILYDVAVSIDGFIAGPGNTPAETIQHFVGEGEHVADYQARLQTCDTALMGRSTYEFGYAFGLEPGRAAYPHMQNIVFSASMREPQKRDANFTLVRSDTLGFVRELRAQDGGDIYLCGGGELAGNLLRAGLIQRLVLKLNPIVLGSGIRLFGSQPVAPEVMQLRSTTRYDSGVVLLEYDLTASG